MSYLSLKAVTKRYPNGFLAVKGVDLSIEKGQFVVLLGPSGCGKTTTLRMIAGLEEVTSGEISLAQRRVEKCSPADRDIAFVFQFFALYPHLSVRKNMAFPLKAQGMPQAEIDKLVDETAALLGVEELLKRKPGELSGGDQQRVSLARALVRQPKAFLMDEPLGQCDLHRRETLRDEIKRLHVRSHATTVYVTHDQAEALSLADVVVLMHDGEIQQIASPQEIYRRPANLFAAHFIGSPGMALLKGTVRSTKPLLLDGVVPEHPLPVPLPAHGLSEGQAAIIGLRPEDIEVVTLAGGVPEGYVPGKVPFREHLGAYDLLDIELGETPEGEEIVLKVRSEPNEFAGATGVYFRIKDGRGVLYDPQTEKAL